MPEDAYLQHVSTNGASSASFDPLEYYEKIARRNPTAIAIANKMWLDFPSLDSRKAIYVARRCSPEYAGAARQEPVPGHSYAFPREYARAARLVYVPAGILPGKPLLRRFPPVLANDTAGDPWRV
ncbi:Uu.00g037180.m01.CDS01 [Anthostomella pinea]|uniref:Uu.00g037180.m01.CDS01 n=1 Tax=Anthostomella pinea TaxID=933095 RepID=A0AAI8YDL6_9PEZI|nr:Uu.00g037180.m01.CDS01 [Anthostomella pinea]